jgi:hypothetical protein
MIVYSLFFSRIKGFILEPWRLDTGLEAVRPHRQKLWVPHCFIVRDRISSTKQRE